MHLVGPTNAIFSICFRKSHEYLRTWSYSVCSNKTLETTQLASISGSKHLSSSHCQKLFFVKKNELDLCISRCINLSNNADCEKPSYKSMGAVWYLCFCIFTQPVEVCKHLNVNDVFRLCRYFPTDKER